MALAVVRNLASPRRLVTGQDAEDFEQELVDQYALAMAACRATDGYVASERGVIFEFRGSCAAGVDDRVGGRGPLPRELRRDRGQARQTVGKKAGAMARFFDFLMARYQGDIHALTGCVLIQPIDEFNRPAKAEYGTPRVPPPEQEVEALFAAWRDSAARRARKYLPAARDYVAASLWRRVGLRINETVMLDIRDWRPDLGEHGKLHVRFGKGSRGRGPKTAAGAGDQRRGRAVDWWLTDVRHQFGDDWSDPDAPMLPSERRDPLTGRCAPGRCRRAASGLAGAVGRWLPRWSGRLTPHVLRHYCASSLYARGHGPQGDPGLWVTSGCRPRRDISTSTTTTSNTPGRAPTTGSRPGCRRAMRGR